MLRLIYLLTFASIFVAAIPSNRIIGGIVAESGQFPWHVQLRSKGDGEFVCSGSILNEKWILTAAHCVRYSVASKIEIVTGSTQLSEPGDVYSISKIVVHPQDNPSKKQNDIALLQIEREIKMNEKVKSIEIGTAKEGDDVVLSGWGVTKYPNGPVPDNLLYANLVVDNHSTCVLQWLWYYSITDNQICTSTKSGRGSCNGDSGGPLVKKENDSWKQIGVVSFGQPCAVGWPDVFTYPDSYLDWIKKIIE